MWTALSSILALFAVVGLNIAAIKGLATLHDPALGQVLTTGIWALQVPLASLFLNARRGEKTPTAASAIEVTSGRRAFTLLTVYGILTFVIIQLISALFGAAVVFCTRMIESLCRAGDPARCALIPADPLGASTSMVLIGGGALGLFAGLIAFGFFAYRLSWQLGSRAWAAALLLPWITASLLLLENIVTLTVVQSIDSTLDKMNWLQITGARAIFAVAGMIAAGIGWALCRKVHRPARRLSQMLRHASRGRQSPPAASIKESFLAVLGFDTSEHELVVRKRTPRRAEGDFFSS
jgi:hypothetical protein